MESQIGRPAQRVLVVDDNIDAAQSLAMALTACGFSVRTAYDGSAAVRLVEELTPELVLSDIEMPGMCGITEARAVRALPLPKQPWMVAMTGTDCLSMRQKAFEAGFDHFFCKPVMLPELISLCERLSVQRRHMR